MSDTAIEYLVGSAARPAALRALRDHGQLSVREFEARVSASRRTLKRTLGAMESRGWVRPTDDGYELTSLGATTLAAYERCREHERTAERFRPVLERTPAEALDVGVDALCGATLVRPTDDPTAPTDRLLDLRANAARIRECAPVLREESLAQFADRVTSERSPPTVTLVLADGGPAPEQYTPTCRDRFETLCAAPSVDIYVARESRLPFGVADGHAFVGTVDDDGMPGALLDGDGTALVEWAERRFEAVLADATPLESA